MIKSRCHSSGELSQSPQKQTELYTKFTCSIQHYKKDHRSHIPKRIKRICSRTFTADTPETPAATGERKHAKQRQAQLKVMTELRPRNVVAHKHFRGA